jgi:hypothetical protein
MLERERVPMKKIVVHKPGTVKPSGSAAPRHGV